MILLPTLWKTVKWKPILFWYTVVTLLFWFSYDPSKGPLLIAMSGQAAMTVMAALIIFMVWDDVVTDRHGLTLSWLFSTVVKDIRVFENKNSDLLWEMKDWCSDNCSKKWRHCKHGYFVFRSKHDALLFKMTWV